MYSKLSLSSSLILVFKALIVAIVSSFKSITMASKSSFLSVSLPVVELSTPYIFSTLKSRNSNTTFKLLFHLVQLIGVSLDHLECLPYVPYELLEIDHSSFQSRQHVSIVCFLDPPTGLYWLNLISNFFYHLDWRLRNLSSNTNYHETNFSLVIHMTLDDFFASNAPKST